MNTTSDSPSHRFLLRIAEDLARSDVSFPTYLDAAIRIRQALNNPDLTLEELSCVLLSEPLVSTKVIRLANSVAMNPSGRDVSDVKAAVMRVGFNAIRTLAIAVAIEQLMRKNEMAPYAARTRQLWEHSLEVAALSFLIAQHMTTLNPDEALFAGLVHDIGHFYLLSQVAQNPQIARDDEDLHRILGEWHVSIGSAVLTALDAPDSVLLAMHAHETPFAGERPTTLGAVLYAANCLAAHPNPFGDAPVGHPSPASDAIALMLDESHDEFRSLIGALAG